MAQNQIKKVDVVCFLEAVKMTLDHISRYRLEMSQRGLRGASDLPQLYGDVRRLRDYLQRGVSACHDVVELDLSPEDRSLLVACCRRAVDSIDLRLEGEELVAEEERQWLQRKRVVLGDWVVEFAEKPLRELPIPKLSNIQTKGAKALHVRLQAKLYGDSPTKLITTQSTLAPTKSWSRTRRSASDRAYCWNRSEKCSEFSYAGSYPRRRWSKT